MRAVLRALLSPRRIAQFTSVGVVGAVSETLVVAALTAWGTADPLLAKAVGAEISISLMFVFNDRVTFATEGVSDLRHTLYRWGRSHLVRSGGISIAFMVLWVLTTQTTISLVVAGANLWPTVANLIGIGVGLSVNYVAESVFTWQVHR